MENLPSISSPFQKLLIFHLCEKGYGFIPKLRKKKFEESDWMNFNIYFAEPHNTLVFPHEKKKKKKKKIFETPCKAQDKRGSLISTFFYLFLHENIYIAVIYEAIPWQGIQINRVVNCIFVD